MRTLTILIIFLFSRFVNFKLRKTRVLGGGITIESSMYQGLTGEIAKQKQLRHLTYQDIAKMSGVSLGAVKAFMTGVRRTDRTARAIARALQIEI